MIRESPDDVVTNWLGDSKSSSSSHLTDFSSIIRNAFLFLTSYPQPKGEESENVHFYPNLSLSKPGEDSPAARSPSVLILTKIGVLFYRVTPRRYFAGDEKIGDRDNYNAPRITMT
jgi:hypothetical protein